jgi:hypothetical protein
MVTLFTTKPPNLEIQRFINEAKTIASIDQQVEAWHDSQPAAPAPVVIDHPIDNTLQTGDSKLLGGAMEIKSPWKQ